MTIEQIYEIADNRGIAIYAFPMLELRAISLRGGHIAIDRSKFASDVEYKCALVHEIGHCVTDSFYNLHTSVPVKELIERQANRFAAELLVPFAELRRAFNRGILFNRILARMFDVTVEFINMVLELFEYELLSAARARQTAHAATEIATNNLLEFIRNQAPARTG